jgi:hypothetical protein
MTFEAFVSETGKAYRVLSMASPEQAFDYVSRLEHLPAWHADVVAVRPADDDAPAVGKTYTADWSVFGGFLRLPTTFHHLEIVAFERPTYLRFMRWSLSTAEGADSFPGSIDSSIHEAFLIEPQDNGCIVTVEKQRSVFNLRRFSTRQQRLNPLKGEHVRLKLALDSLRAHE